MIRAGSRGRQVLFAPLVDRTHLAVSVAAAHAHVKHVCGVLRRRKLVFDGGDVAAGYLQVRGKREDEGIERCSGTQSKLKSGIIARRGAERYGELVRTPGLFRDL